VAAETHFAVFYFLWA